MKKGETRASLSVHIINDTHYDSNYYNTDEDFKLKIISGSLPDGVYPGNKSTTTVIIVDDECK